MELQLNSADLSRIIFDSAFVVPIFEYWLRLGDNGICGFGACVKISRSILAFMYAVPG